MDNIIYKTQIVTKLINHKTQLANVVFNGLIEGINVGDNISYSAKIAWEPHGYDFPINGQIDRIKIKLAKQDDNPDVTLCFKEITVSVYDIGYELKGHIQDPTKIAYE